MSDLGLRLDVVVMKPTHVADLEEQALEVRELVWGQAQETCVRVQDASSEGLVGVEGICERRRRYTKGEVSLSTTVYAMSVKSTYR